MLSLDQTNTTGFLFGDEDGAGSSETNSYLQKNATEDGFPILVRGSNPNQVSFLYFFVRDDSVFRISLMISCSYPHLHQLSI